RKILEKSGKSMFTLQVGAFSIKENADVLANQLEEKGYTAYIITTRLNDKIIYKVQTGIFKNRSMAEEQQAKLKDQGFSAVPVARSKSAQIIGTSEKSGPESNSEIPPPGPVEKTGALSAKDKSVGGQIEEKIRPPQDKPDIVKKKESPEKIAVVKVPEQVTEKSGEKISKSETSQRPVRYIQEGTGIAPAVSGQAIPPQKQKQEQEQIPPGKKYLPEDTGIASASPISSAPVIAAKDVIHTTREKEKFIPKQSGIASADVDMGNIPQVKESPDGDSKYIPKNQGFLAIAEPDTPDMQKRRKLQKKQFFKKEAGKSTHTFSELASAEPDENTVTIEDEFDELERKYSEKIKEPMPELKSIPDYNPPEARITYTPMKGPGIFKPRPTKIITAHSTETEKYFGNYRDRAQEGIVGNYPHLVDIGSRIMDQLIGLGIRFGGLPMALHYSSEGEEYCIDDMNRGYKIIYDGKGRIIGFHIFVPDNDNDGRLAYNMCRIISKLWFNIYVDPPYDFYRDKAFAEWGSSHVLINIGYGKIARKIPRELKEQKTDEALEILRELKKMEDIEQRLGREMVLQYVKKQFRRD
ncbi:MAG: SPOR domain-containing protein, partial [Candidatus Eremiobacteraeota bacterium]|nr:SPOR domain-containing protein [Candidatus Eremiobacteraeota bacterium]